MAKKITQIPNNTLSLDFDEGQKEKKSIDKELLKYRIRYSIGMFLILISLILLVSFSSSFFFGVADQSEMADGDIQFLESSDIPVDNLAGIVGAKLSYFFLFKWFGISSLLLIPLFFLSGLKLVLNRKFELLAKLTWQVLFFTLWLSIFLGFLTYRFQLPNSLAGGIGFFINEKLFQLVGYFSVFIILLIGGVFSILFYQLNPVKQRTEKSPFGDTAGLDELFLEDEEEEKYYEETEDEAQIKPEMPALVNSEEGRVKSEEGRVKSEEEKVKSEEEKVNSEEGEGEGEEKEDLDFSFKVAEEDSKAEEKQIGLFDEDDNEAIKKLGVYDPTLDLSSYLYPSIDLMKDYQNSDQVQVSMEELKENKNQIVTTLSNYGIEIQKIEATIGPTVTLYEIVPKAGVRVSKITSLEDDLALSLAALGVRIIGQMPGRGTIGIEVANKNREMVPCRTVISSEKFQKSMMELPIGLGKTISNEIFVTDLAKMPHLLVAGATGQGKSVGINMILTSLLYKKHPATLKFVLVDPKKVELSLFNKIERHFLAKLPDDEDAIITDTKKVVNTLNSLCKEMDLRYDLLKDAGCRNIKEYNQKFINRKLNPETHKYLPYIVLVIDELADLMLTAGKEVEHPIARLAQLARAIGIHLVVATQRPSVNVITGTIKANFPARLSFKVMSKIDSRTILDSSGADQLIGMGDMLLSLGSDIIRLQCAFVDTPEVDAVCEYIGEQRGYPSAYLLPECDDSESGGLDREDIDLSERDSFFEDAARLVVMHQQGSTSLIQRKLRLGYNRAGRLMDQLEAAGIVGAFGGSKAREVLVKDEMELENVFKELNQ